MRIDGLGKNICSAHDLQVCKGNKCNGSIACEKKYFEVIFELVMEQMYVQEFHNYIHSEQNQCENKMWMQKNPEE